MLKEATRTKNTTRRHLDIQLESKSLVRESISIKEFMEKMSQYLKVTPFYFFFNDKPTPSRADMLANLRGLGLLNDERIA